MNEQPPMPSSETPKLTACPSCHSPVNNGDLQCQQCGLIYSKWKDPTQRAAEAKLEAFAKQANQGLPKWLYGVFILLIGFPLIVIFVPEVGIPVRGGKLRYHFTTKTRIRHEATSQLTISSGSQLLDQIELVIQTTLRCSETDTGGNSTLKLIYDRAALTAVSAGRSPQEKQSLSNWDNSWVMNPRGETISTMMGVTNQVRTNSETMKQHQKMRSMGYGRDNQFEKESESVPPPQDSYDQIFEEFNPSFLGHLNLAIYFKWPNERVKTGVVLNQPFSTVLVSRLFRTDVNIPTVPFKLENFERIKGGYMIVLTWETPVTLALSASDGPANSLFSQNPATGTYKGTAWVNYQDGVIQKLEGELNASWTVPGQSESILTQALGYPIDGGSSLQIKMTQNVRRL